MELKKIVLTLFLLIFANKLNSAMILPQKILSAYDVVEIQLNALKNNNSPSKNSGIKQVWLFAHPDNRKSTGPFKKFQKMIYSKQYEHLIEHNTHTVKLIMNTSVKYVFGVEILNKNKEIFFYEWHVEKGNDLDCKNCWFTSAVSIPVNQGNTI